MIPGLPAAVLVVDEVGVADNQPHRALLWHLPHEPMVEAGHVQLDQGTASSLHLYPLLPADVTVTVVDERDFQVYDGTFHGYTPVQSGVDETSHRVEVTPATARPNEVFVTVLQPTLYGVAVPSRPQVHRNTLGVAGASVGTLSVAVVLAPGELRYQSACTSSQLRHQLYGLPAGSYDAIVDGVAQRNTLAADGSLTFDAPCVGADSAVHIVAAGIPDAGVLGDAAASADASPTVDAGDGLDAAGALDAAFALDAAGPTDAGARDVGTASDAAQPRDGGSADVGPVERSDAAVWRGDASMSPFEDGSVAQAPGSPPDGCGCTPTAAPHTPPWWWRWLRCGCAGGVGAGASARAGRQVSLRRACLSRMARRARGRHVHEPRPHRRTQRADPFRPCAHACSTMRPSNDHPRCGCTGTSPPPDASG